MSNNTKPRKSLPQRPKATVIPFRDKRDGPFRHDDERLRLLYSPPKEKEASTYPVCGWIKVIATVSDRAKERCETVVRIRYLEGERETEVSKQFAIPNELLDDSRALSRWLRHNGLWIAPRQLSRVQQFLSLERTRLPHRTWVDTLGWHDGAYVMSDRTIGTPHHGNELVARVGHDVDMHRQGTWRQWRDDIGARCVDNPLLLLGTSLAFAAALLEPLGVDGFGVHLYNKSSTGKTTIGFVTGSVWGSPARLQTWRTTANALERIAQAHCDSCLVLDEIKQVSARDVAAAIYMLSAGVGKLRMNADSTLQPIFTFRTAVLSTGEKTVESHMQSQPLAKAERADTGQTVRLIELFAARTHGVFDHLHGAVDGDDFATHMKAAAERHYGHAGPLFVQRFIDERDRWQPWAVQFVDTFVADAVAPYAGDAVSGQVYRVARNFAVIAVGGELATQYGLTGWPAHAARDAALTCFHGWVEHRGGVGSGEATRLLAQTRKFFQQRGINRHFPPWYTFTGKSCPKCQGTGATATGGRCAFCEGEGDLKYRDDGTASRVGFRRPAKDNPNETEYWVFTEMVEEIHKPFELAFAIAVWRDAGMLKPCGQSPTWARRWRDADGGNHSDRFYVFTEAALGIDRDAEIAAYEPPATTAIEAHAAQHRALAKQAREGKLKPRPQRES